METARAEATSLSGQGRGATNELTLLGRSGGAIMNSTVQLTQRDMPRRLLQLSVVLFCLAVAAPARGQCDMGNAYSYTDTWATEYIDPPNQYKHWTNPPGSPTAWGKGVVENDYNTCSHSYYTVVTMTGPRGGYSEGIDMASLPVDVYVDGEYLTNSQLFYYCEYAARDFYAGMSSNLLESSGINEIWLGKTEERIVFINAFKEIRWCYYRACLDTDQNPANNCFFVDFHEEWDIQFQCPPGVRAQYARFTIPFLGFSFCYVFSHNHLVFDPCPFGKL